MVPAVQTLAAQLALNRQPGVHASLGSVAAGFGEVDVDDARVEMGCGVLTAPRVEARMPVLQTLRSGSLRVGSLSAKGWTLDLSRAPAGAPPRAAAAGQTGPGAAAQAVSLALSALRTWQVPFAGSVDGVDIEGDVLLPSPDGAAPVQVHLVVKGGGLGAGRRADLEVDAATVGAQIPAAFMFARGHVTADLGPDGKIGRIRANADFSPAGDPTPGNPGMSVAMSADRGGDSSTCEVDASRGARRLASVRARAEDSTGRMSGSWSVDAGEADLAPLSPYLGMAPASVEARGSFDAARPFESLHARGHLKAAGRLPAGFTGMNGAPPGATLEADFDVAVRSGALAFARLEASGGAVGASFSLRTLRPFEVRTGERGAALTVAPGAFAEGSFRDLPLALVTRPADRLGFAAGLAAGQFAVRATDGGFSGELKEPASASGVALRGPGSLLGSGLELSLSLRAACSSGAWDVTVAPMVFQRAGREVASLRADAVRPAGPGQPFTVTGTWTADPQALDQSSGPGASLSAYKSITGSFTASVAGAISASGKVEAAGLARTPSASADFKADMDSEGDFTFNVPARVELAGAVSELTADGGVSFDGAETRIEAKVEGDDVALEHLGLLAGPLLALQTQPGVRGPAWGALKGRVEFSFKRLRSAGEAYEEVNGVLTLDHDSARLNGGRVWLMQHDLAIVTGLLTFDPARRPAYDLKANVSLGDFDASAIFGKGKSDRLALVEGRFALEDAVTAASDDLGGLAGAAREDMEVRSPGGILRLLKVDVADAIPEEKTRVSDTLGDVGSAVGAIFGIKHESENAGRNPVSKEAESVLSFTYDISEIGYDRLVAKVRRDPQGGMHLADIDVVAPNEHITGAGDVGRASGLAFPARPLSLVLRLAVKGDPAKLLGSAGLLSGEKDALGYSALAQPIRLGGTLEQVDATPWHDLLAAVAAKAAAAGPKPK